MAKANWAKAEANLSMATAATAAAKAPAATAAAIAAAERAGVVSKLLQSEQDETAAGVMASPGQAAAAPIAKKADAGAEQANVHNSRHCHCCWHCHCCCRSG